MWKLRLVPKQPSVAFMRAHIPALALSGILLVVSLVSYFTEGLNYGIDFRGGTLFEIRTTETEVDVARVRSTLGTLELGDISIQRFGKPEDILIRVQRQPGGAKAEQAVVGEVKRVLRSDLGNIVEFRRVETVGPRVSGELKRKGAMALGFALIAMLLYIWFRFEWQFSLGAVAALVHDVVLSLGFLVVTGVEFNLATVAAILTIIGYSMNDTVVVYDRIRENLRKYKKMDLRDILDLSVNNTLSRTTITSVTTLLALLALVVFGGANIAGFTLVMIWGVIIGTYSSIFIAGPLLLYLDVRREAFVPKNDSDQGNQ